jgi:hypothetical protein
MDHTAKLLMGFIFLLALFFSPLEPCRAMEGPDMVVIDTLAQLFEPVSFDHAMHVEVADSCATCHHHTTGTPVEDANCGRCHANSGPTKEIACHDCHAAKRFEADYLNKLDEDNSIYHVDKVGLKGAYHIRCMNCHEKMGAPKGCQDCHPINEAGDKFYHAGDFAPPPLKEGESAHGEGH